MQPRDELSAPDDPRTVPGAGEHAFQLLLRTRLDHETELLMQRTTWVVASQAFLFSAYAIALNDRVMASSSHVAAQSSLLVRLIPWVAVGSLLLLYVTISGGVSAMFRLRRHLMTDHDPWLRVLDGTAAARAAGMIAPLLIPGAFLVVWLVLITNR